MHKKHLKVGIFTDDFYPKSGGVARSIELQLRELTEMGHEVVLFAPKTNFIPPDTCKSEGLPVWYVPGSESYLCSVKFGYKLALRIARQYKFDIIHSQNERGSMFLASRIAQILDVPHIHTFHSNYAGTHRTSPFWAALNTMTYMRLAPKIMHRVRPARADMKIYLPHKLSSVEDSRLARSDWKSVAKLARYTDAFTSPAQFMIDSIVDASRGKLADRGYVVPNGISDIFGRATRIRPKDDTFRFISCGRLDPEKRVDVIIKAFAKLKRDDAELFIVGRGAAENDLKRLAKRIVKHGKVSFRGHHNDLEHIANEFANSDVFVFASYRFDTQGMVLAEAAASGAPILYCDDRLHVGVSPDNALLVHPSVTAISKGMRELMSDRPRLDRMSTASKKLAHSLTARAMEEKFVGVYISAKLTD